MGRRKKGRQEEREGEREGDSRMWTMWRETKCPPYWAESPQNLDLTKYDSLRYGGLKEKGVAGAQEGGRERAANRIVTRYLGDLTLL